MDMILSNSSFVTLTEIAGQPKLWLEVLRAVRSRRSDLERFFKSLPEVDVILTGAGSSAFVAEALVRDFERHSGWRSRAVATTDLVTHPEDHFRKGPTLLVSFARSGNSPESLAAVQLANQFANAYHLIITCNADGQLAKAGSSSRSYVMLLPDQANDRGLAMIGSVTGMILTALAVTRLDKLESFEMDVKDLSNVTAEWLGGPMSEVKSLATLPFERVVCLGSGPFLAVAREAHLKIQELSDGKIMGQWDSFLGFRHGPRAIVHGNTLLIFLSSPYASVRRYEEDLVHSIVTTQKPAATWIIGTGTKTSVTFQTQWSKINPTLHLVASLVPVQVLAAKKSIELGLNPDSPSPSGAIHRVVQGVTIYPYSAS